MLGHMLLLSRWLRSRGVEMRVKPGRGGSNAGGCELSTSPDRRSGAIARRSAILLSGTAAIALSIAQPASAIVVNDKTAADAGGVPNYYDSGNQYPNVVTMLRTNPFTGDVVSFCTSSLTNPPTLLPPPPFLSHPHTPIKFNALPFN